MALYIILVILLLGLVAVTGYSFGFFRFEQVKVKDSGDDDEFSFPEEEDKFDEFSSEDEFNFDDFDYEDNPPSVEEEEKVDLFDIFPDEENQEEQPEQQQQRKWEEHESFDRLCEFPAGRSYLTLCQKVLDEARQNGQLYAAVRLDVDRFRFINSIKGFSIGDYVLTRLSQDMQMVFPANSIFTRLSADHFAILMPVSDPDIFPRYMEQLRTVCDKVRGDIGAKSAIKISMGVAATSQLAGDWDMRALMLLADIARHCIKVSKVESLAVFDPTMLTTFLYGESAMEDYSENQYDDEFVLYYSPISDIGTSRITGSAVLSRWACEDNNDKDGYLLEADTRILTNGAKVIYQVCKSMSRWRKAGKEPLPVHVPVPVTELLKEDFDSFVQKCLAEFQLEAPLLRLTFEASVAVLDLGIVTTQMNKLRELGVGIGIIGVDPGYSDITFLANLPIQCVEFHHSFVRNIQKEEWRREPVQRLQQMADQMNVQTIFTGVDNQDQALVLKELGVAQVQGKYCGKPLQADDFIRGLDEFAQKMGARGGATVILDDVTAKKGDYRIF